MVAILDLKGSLRSIVKALDSERLNEKVNWALGVKLIVDGQRILKQYDSDTIENDPELKHMKQYLDEQSSIYWQGQRSNFLTRRKFVNSLINI